MWNQNSSDESSGTEERETQEEEVVEERIPMEISPGLKRLLEHDCTLINKHNKVYILAYIKVGFLKKCTSTTWPSRVL